jgi:hypothetical protein
MMGSYDHIWAKSEMRGAVSLAMHLRQTAICAVYIAGWMGLDPRIARLGALLHDIGKASILFQNFLRQNATYPFPFRFRHEIASLFFLSLVEKAERPYNLPDPVGIMKTDKKPCPVIENDSVSSRTSSHQPRKRVHCKLSMNIIRPEPFMQCPY